MKIPLLLRARVTVNVHIEPRLPSFLASRVRVNMHIKRIYSYFLGLPLGSTCVLESVFFYFELASIRANMHIKKILRKEIPLFLGSRDTVNLHTTRVRANTPIKRRFPFFWGLDLGSTCI